MMLIYDDQVKTNLASELSPRRSEIITKSASGFYGDNPMMPASRELREELIGIGLNNLASKEAFEGNRSRPEVPEKYLTCYEVDKDRILLSSAFRRLARKTQVFAFPGDHLRNRLTHAVEVAQIASRITKAVGLNANLAEAIALGHDIGHGPGGHAAEEAFAKFIPNYFYHGSFGADVVLAPLNLCEETLDGIRNHSWSRPIPKTPEAAVVSFADRIAYCSHDLEDALAIKMISKEMIPEDILALAGKSKESQVNTFIDEMIYCFTNFSVIGMRKDYGEALAAFRKFNFEFIYSSPEVQETNKMFIRLSSELVEYYISHPEMLGENAGDSGGQEEDRIVKAINYVATMTDDYALQTGRDLLGFQPLENMAVRSTFC